MHGALDAGLAEGVLEEVLAPTEGDVAPCPPDAQVPA